MFGVQAAACVAAMCPSLSLANGIRLPDQDAEATARGEAFIATADNPAAVYYNPAGISQLDGHRVSDGAYTLSFTTEYQADGGRRIDSADAVHFVPSIHYTFSPSESALSYGLGAYSPYGLSIEWPEDSGFRSKSIRAAVTYMTLNPVIAWRITPELSIGVGATLNYARLELAQGLSTVPGRDEFEFDGNGFSAGLSAGILWRPAARHSFGLSYRGPTTIDLDGDTSVSMAPVGVVHSEAAAARFPFPQHLGAGYSYRPSPRWNIEIDAVWTDWSSVDTVQIRQATPVPGLVLNWHPSMYYCAGVTRYFERGWALSWGYFFNENSVPDETFNPLVPDQDRHFYSIGCSQEWRRLTWSAAYQLGYGPPRDVYGSAPSSAGQDADGQYSFLSHALSVSLGYRF